MAESQLKKQTFKSVLWKFTEVGGRQLVQFFISILLARLIAPSQFGAIAMLTIFIAVSNTIIDSGFSNALIRKNNRNNVDCSTVFYFNLVISCFLYIVLYICAPSISRFYSMPILKPVLRISSITLIITGITSIQNTLYRANMNFKILAKYNVLSLLLSGTIGIIMAYLDFQIWALVTQNLLNSILSSVFLWIKSSWRPKLEFSFDSLKEFFNFGSKYLASKLLDSIYSNMYGVVIGKIFTPSNLAYYNRSVNLSSLTSSIPTNILQSVTFPTLCKLQNDDTILKESYRKILKTSSFVIFPLCLGVGALSFPLINELYTTKWIYAANLLQIIVFAEMWYPIHAINLNLLMVKGRSDLFFRLEVIKKIQGVIMLCITVPLGLEAICYGCICTSIIALAINTHYTGKLLNMGFWKQMKDYLPFLILSCFMFVICKVLTTILGNGWLSLCVGILTGIAIYLGGTLLFKFPEFKELISLIKGIRK